MDDAFAHCVAEIRHMVHGANDVNLRRSGISHLIFMCGCPVAESPCAEQALAALGDLATSRASMEEQGSDAEEKAAAAEDSARDFRPMMLEAGVVTVLAGALSRRGGARSFTRAALRDAAWCFVQLTEPCADNPGVRGQLLREGALDALAAICDIAEDDATWDYASWAMHQIGQGAEDEAEREARLKREGRGVQRAA